MADISEIVNILVTLVPALRTIVIAAFVFFMFNSFLDFIISKLQKKHNGKRHTSNIELFSRALKYLFFLFLLLISVLSYSGSWTGLGLTLGLFTASLGFALQRPITGIAAWIMVLLRRPFDIGDRVIIGNVRGDVEDITLSHVYLREIGGTVPSEENSGRIILVPNTRLFEENIINYTLYDEFVLDEVVTSVTYESNLDEAIVIILKCAKTHLDEFSNRMQKDPYVRVFFQPSGINVNVRYFAPARRLQEISSEITRDIHKNIAKTNNVEIAYPHTEIIYRKK